MRQRAGKAGLIVLSLVAFHRVVADQADRRGGGLAVDRKIALRDFGRVAQAAIGHQAGHAAHFQPRHQDAAGGGRAR